MSYFIDFSLEDEEGENAESIDMNKILTKQRENQEKLALEMLKSVESIKNNSLIAKKIIEKDNIVSSDWCKGV